MKLQYELKKRNELIEANIKQIKEIEKIPANHPTQKDAIRKAEELIIRNKAVMAENDGINKSIDILEHRVMPDDVARGRRTKKNREGQPRKR